MSACGRLSVHNMMHFLVLRWERGTVLLCLPPPPPHVTPSQLVFLGASLCSVSCEQTQLHLYSVSRGANKPSAVEVTGGDIMTSIQSVVAFHPSRDVLAGVNSSGRAHIFM